MKSFSAEAQTHTDEALRAAFAEKDVDTIYLLSDGAPYKLEHGSSVSVKFIQDIIAWVARENRFRKVKIHTFGFEEVAEEDACNIEHILDKQSIDGLEKFLDLAKKMTEANPGWLNDLRKKGE